MNLPSATFLETVKAKIPIKNTDKFPTLLAQSAMIHTLKVNSETDSRTCAMGVPFHSHKIYDGLEENRLQLRNGGG